jgi:heptosyltransferase-2
LCKYRPLHIAAALKIKSVSLFCPLTACSPKLWGPVGNKSIELIPDANYCAGNCPKDPKKCKYENDGIKIDTILQSINKLLMN